MAVIRAFAILAMFVPAVAARAEFPMTAPLEMKTTAEIRKWVEKEDMQGGLRAKPHVSSADYRGPSPQAFVAWHNPYSGEAARHVYIYVYDDKKENWVRKLAKVFKGTHSASVEFGDAITIRDVKGKVIHQEKATAE